MNNIPANIRQKSPSNQRQQLNRLSLGSWLNQNDGYDFKIDNRVNRSNSFKQNDENVAGQVTNKNKSKLIEPDSISEMSFPAITRRLSSHLASRFRRKQRATSVTINPADLIDDTLTFDGVLFYLSTSNGLAGSLTANSKKIIFTSGLVELMKINNHSNSSIGNNNNNNIANQNQIRKNNFLLNEPKPSNPFYSDFDSQQMETYEINLSNIADVSLETPTNSNERSIIYIHCTNFKHVKIGLKQLSAESLYKLIIEHQKMNNSSSLSSSTQTQSSSMTSSITSSSSQMHSINIHSNNNNDQLINSSSSLISNSSTMNYCRPLLWEYLHDNYHYRVRSDWVKYEKWYVNNFKIQFSQFNELDCPCPSLPEIVIVPRKVTDQELESIANISDGQRVPIITYLNRKSGNMLIRSTTYNSNRLSLYKIYYAKIFDDKHNSILEFNVAANVPSNDDLERAHTKLRKACFKTIKLNQKTQNYQLQKLNNNEQLQSYYNIDYCKHFWTKCSSWLLILSKLLRTCYRLSETIRKIQSVGLIEKYDSNWNCLLSSLIQLFIDPDKRTIKGFQQLLSKEWLYLSGYKRMNRRFDYEDIKYRPMNCPNQIIFLLFLDLVHQLLLQNQKSFEFSTFFLILLLDYQVNSDLPTKENYMEIELNQKHCLIMNPLYQPTSKPLQIKTGIIHVKFFTKLYYRSLGTQLQQRFTSEELLYINELYSKDLL